MDKFFNSAYRGDPGVPHSGPDRFVNVWIGWHDRAMLYEYHWKKAMAQKQPYNFKWNQMDKEVRESYYLNWPVYFP